MYSCDSIIRVLYQAVTTAGDTTLQSNLRAECAIGLGQCNAQWDGQQKGIWASLAAE